MALKAHFNGIVESGSGWIKDIYGDQFWIKDALPQNENELGKIYLRDDAPPVILHREIGPAVLRANGDREWWVNGQLHREGAPAVIRADASFWYRHHKYHREDGPAIERSDGAKEWLLNDKKVSAAEHAKYRESRTTPPSLSAPRRLTAPKLVFAAKA